MIALSTISENGLSVSVPLRFKVISHSPQFQATHKNNSITIVLNPAETLWNGWQRMLREPLGRSPDLDSRVVREGDIDTPYVGFERIVEHFCMATGHRDFAWAMLLVRGATRIIFQIGGSGSFRDGEEMWTQVVQSLRISSDQ